MQYADGSIGKLVEFLDDEKVSLFEDAQKIVDAIKGKDELKALKVFEKISLKSTNILDYLEYLLYFEKLYQDVFEVEKAKQKLKFNGNEDVIKTVLVINMCRGKEWLTIYAGKWKRKIYFRN